MSYQIQVLPLGHALNPNAPPLNISQVETLITTGSSFALATIRPGHSVLYAGRMGPGSGCHPMPNAAFPQEYDDRMEPVPFEDLLKLPHLRLSAPARTAGAPQASALGSHRDERRSLRDLHPLGSLQRPASLHLRDLRQPRFWRLPSAHVFRPRDLTQRRNRPEAWNRHVVPDAE